MAAPLAASMIASSTVSSPRQHHWLLLALISVILRAKKWQLERKNAHAFYVIGGEVRFVRYNAGGEKGERSCEEP